MFMHIIISVTQTKQKQQTAIKCCNLFITDMPNIAYTPRVLLSYNRQVYYKQKNTMKL